MAEKMTKRQNSKSKFHLSFFFNFFHTSHTLHCVSVSLKCFCLLQEILLRQPWELREQSKIYGKNKLRPLTPYEQAINDASFELSRNDPSLLANRAALFELAKNSIKRSYPFKKGYTRSDPRTKPAQPRTSREERKITKAQLQHEMQLIDDEIKLLRAELITVESGGHCDRERQKDKLTRVQELTFQRGEITVRLNKIMRKERQSICNAANYQRKKAGMAGKFPGNTNSWNNSCYLWYYRIPPNKRTDPKYPRPPFFLQNV